MLDEPMTPISKVDWSAQSQEESVDLSKISNKEERVLFGLLASLQENLEMLDMVSEVYTREKTRQASKS